MSWLRVFPLALLLAACTTAGGKSGDDDDDDGTDTTPIVSDDTVPLDFSSSDVTGDDDDDGSDLTVLQFLDALYEGGCQAALDCNASAKVIDLYCNRDVYDYFDSYTTDCSLNQQLAEACLDDGWSCSDDYVVPNSNACEPAIDCG